MDQNLSPQKAHAKFPSHKNFQRNYVAAWDSGTVTNFQIVLNTPKNTYLNQATKKNTRQNFPTQKNPEIKNFKPPNIL